MKVKTAAHLQRNKNPSVISTLSQKSGSSKFEQFLKLQLKFVSHCKKLYFCSDFVKPLPEIFRFMGYVDIF